ncbi:lytic transglycosylase domain-containing protein [Bradyrhizobium sp. 2TAF24]|uniref:lytic transglycosylase domain-containing protein n=1 Tax=Bradyrhizobium sp. 2TAF24 TaxID=3233011 RepID=UPI003F9155B6
MTIDTTSLAAGFESVRARITSAIRQAADATGASFEYLLSAAKMESNLDPGASSSTSSAKGLYQFIEQTWLGTVKEAGPSLGYGKYADAITKSASGTYSVSDPATRDEILKLRDDPAVNAAMAGVLTQSNSFKLTGALGRRPSDGELYIAHFMGAGGAAKLINAAQDSPRADATQMFPNAAAANRPIFYDRNGSARSVSEVYSVLTTRYANAVNAPSTQAALAALGGSPSGGAAAPQADNAVFLSGFPQTQQAATNVAAAPAGVASSQEPPMPRPTFRSLYQAGDRPEPVSTVVQALWGNNTASADPVQGAAAANAPQPLDLFSDRSGRFSS